MGDPSTDLLQQAKKLDIDALARIYDEYSPGVFRYAARMLGDDMLAEDCTAETFHRFLRALHVKRGPDQYLQAYLYRIAHNWITDFYRKNRLPEVPIDEDLHDHQSDLETLTQEQMEQQRVRSYLVKLTPDQRQVIILKYYEGWENEEIAAALKKPVGAVKSLQHRAINQLKKMTG